MSEINQYDLRASDIQKQISKGVDSLGKDKYNQLVNEFNFLIPKMTLATWKKIEIL